MKWKINSHGPIPLDPTGDEEHRDANNEGSKDEQEKQLEAPFAGFFINVHLRSSAVHFSF